MRILLADDERITRLTLTRQLESFGHTVTPAEDGAQALDAFTTSPAPFDLVITDWEMPRLAGPDLVRRLRASPRAADAYTYVVMLTSRSDKSDVVAGIEAGADDFLSKPWDRDELRVRLLAGQRIVTLERALLTQNAALRTASARIRDGLLAAARIQQSMLPREPVDSPRARAAWKYVPTDELAGDAIGLHLVDDRHLVAYVLDVSGHGVPAALLSVAAMHALAPVPADSSLLRNTSPENDPSLGTVRRPALVATELNRRFRAGENDGRYFTMVLCVLDTHTGRLHLTSAGHPPPILLRDGQPVPLPDAGGMPVAVMDDAEYDDASIPLHPGDRLCLYSDGVLEQFDPTGKEQFAEPRLLHSLTKNRTAPPTHLVNAVVHDLTAHAASPSFADDVTIVAIDWLGPTAPT